MPTSSRMSRRMASGRPAPLPAAPLVRCLRLQLAPEIGRGTLDGAWWPYGRDLAIEVLDLRKQFPAMLGRLSRVVYSSPDWALNRRRRIQADEEFVSIESFPRDHAHLVVLRSVSPRVSRVLRLLLVPPEWDERAARYAMRAAAGPDNAASGAALLDRSRALLLAGLLSHHVDGAADAAAPAIGGVHRDVQWGSPR